MNNFLNDPRILRGMETQLNHRRDRLEAGEKPIGWKIGFGAPAALERLHLEAPLVGFLTDKALLGSGAKVSLTGWTKPAIEPEIAVHLGKELSGKVKRAEARESIASIGPAIELADVNFPPDDVEMILARNIYNRHFILGRTDASRAGGLLEGLVGRVYRDEHQIATTTDLQAQTGDIIDIVCHTAELLSKVGEKLSGGEVIIMGSIVPPLWIEKEEEIKFHLDPIDEISVKVYFS